MALECGSARMRRSRVFPPAQRAGRSKQHWLKTLLVILAGSTLVSATAIPAGAAELDGLIEMVIIERTDDGGLEVRTVQVSSPAQGAVVAASSMDPRIVSVEPQGEFHAFLNDAKRGSQWALDRVSFETSWTDTNGTGAVVAVLDTGIKASHEDFVGAVIPGADFVGGSGDGTLADHYHGSHVAGIIAAEANNLLGIAGAAPGVQILPVRVLNEYGSGSTYGVASGIIWAADNGADVINMSLGSNSDSTSMRTAVDYAESKGVVVVAAAGNAGESGNPITYPAAIPAVVAVSATTSADLRASYSNYGSWVDIAAPGSGIWSLSHISDSSYTSSTGTSMAAPFVAAVAALIKAKAPTLTAAEVRAIIASSAEDLGTPGTDDEFGAGLIDPIAALAATPASGDDSSDDEVSPDEEAASAGYQLLTSLGRLMDPIEPASNTAAVVGSTVTGSAVTGAIDGLNDPIVGGAPTPSGNGAWLVAADGGIFTVGDAGFFGSAGAMALSHPIVGMAASPTGNGYWLVASDGGIFGYGDAGFYGSTGNIALNQPITGMAASPTGNGYWLVASDGGIFTFGDAVYHGSTGNIALNQPITGMAASPTGNGYWLVASDGGIFTFGDAVFSGSVAGLLEAGEFVVGMVAD